MNTEKRLVHLDALRGIAAMLVVIDHFVERTPLNASPFFTYLNLGQMGVVIFFVLSGMVIPYSLKADSSLLGFATSRIFRLYPAYWFSIALAVLSNHFFLSTTTSLRDILINMTMLQSLFSTSNLFGVYWTLIIELAFYIFCALLSGAGLLKKQKIRFIVSIVLLILALLLSILRFHLEKKLPVAVPLCMSIMFFGSLWRDVSLGSTDQKPHKYSFIWLTLFFVLLVPICLLAYNKDYGHGENATAYLLSYTGGLVFTLITTLFFRRRISSLIMMEYISYSMYLVHPFLLEWISSKVDMASSFNISAFLVYLGTTGALASATYLLIEKPFLKFGNALRIRITD
jgi:peptidoglycan/LPS O-acetylase OafA/YrhL